MLLHRLVLLPSLNVKKKKSEKSQTTLINSSQRACVRVRVGSCAYLLKQQKQSSYLLTGTRRKVGGKEKKKATRLKSCPRLSTLLSRVSLLFHFLPVLRSSSFPFPRRFACLNNRLNKKKKRKTIVINREIIWIQGKRKNSAIKKKKKKGARSGGTTTYCTFLRLPIWAFHFLSSNAFPTPSLFLLSAVIPQYTLSID